MTTFINTLLSCLAIGYIIFYLRNTYISRRDLNFENRTKYFFVGFITNFFDFFGIGSYAPQTLFLKNDVDDIYLIPGTLSIANYLPIVLEAIIAITFVNVDILTLITLPLMASLGSYFAVKFIVAENSKLINEFLVIALLTSGVLLIFNALNIYPFNNFDTNLYGLIDYPDKLAIAAVIYFFLGAMQSFGLGIYAPGFAALGLLGVSYIAILPINMLSSVLLTTSNSTDFIKNKKFSKSHTLVIGISGVLGVLFAGFTATIINIDNYISILQVIVAFVVFFTSFKLFKQT